jgi:hypothetical protein
MDMGVVAATAPVPELVLVAVAEADLHPVMEALPTRWRDRLALLQNELLPRDWEAHGILDPTIISVWFEKKKGQDVKVIIPSPVFGSHARALVDALAAIDIPAREVDSPESMLLELVVKNAYILTGNIAGLAVGGDVGTLWRHRRDVAKAVSRDVLDVQEYLVGRSLDRARIERGMVEAFDGDPAHQCLGRSAPARLARALRLAEEAGLDVPTLRAIEAQVSP